jgi:acyl-CoA synthetase (AMP-forming)/AMP-acid ligase II
VELRAGIDEGQTLYQAVRDAAREFPEWEALVVGADRLTYRLLLQQLDALAAGLERIGLRKGDRVAVILPPSAASVYTLIAPGKLGLVIVPMNPLLRAHEVQHILGDSGATALIAVSDMLGHDYLKMIEAIRPTLPALRHVIVKGEPRAEGVVPLPDVMNRRETDLLTEVEVGPDDLLGFFYTSGTTGLPKGAMQTHRNLMGTVGNGLRISKPERFRSVVTTLPLFHYAGIMTALVTLCIGGKLTIQDTFVPQQALSLLDRERATIMVGVPTMYQAMLRVPNLEEYDLSALRRLTTGAAPCPKEVIQTVEARMGARMSNAYGLTEVGVVSAARGEDPEAARMSSVGQPIPGLQVRIVDDSRESLGTGQPGEVAVKSPYLMEGYHNLPDATASAVDDRGWFYTGDVGFLDEDGYLHLIDRKKDMIIRGGANVYPAEVERFLLTHPKVQAAAVIGVSGSVGGESVWVYIVPKAGAELTAAEVLDYCRDQIAPYKIPDEVRFASELPMTATRKVQKFALRERARRESKQDGSVGGAE